MSEPVDYCPFLNASDSRCATHFSLEHLDSAFDHCFGCFSGCRTYQELLSEKQSAGPVRLGTLPLVQVRVAHHHVGAL